MHPTGVNTTSSTKFSFPCPAGHWCDEEAKPAHVGCAAGVAVQQERAQIALTMTSVDDPRCPCLDSCGRSVRDNGLRCYCPVGLCPAGFICNEGTRLSRIFQTPCKPGWYCPEGTSPDMLDDQKWYAAFIELRPIKVTLITHCVFTSLSTALMVQIANRSLPPFLIVTALVSA